MRLGTCIAFEVVAGLSTLAGLSLGTAYAFGSLRGSVDSTTHPPAAVVRPKVVTPGPAPTPDRPPAITQRLAVPPPEVTAPGGAAVTEVAPDRARAEVGSAVGAGADWAFVGVPDEELLAPLRTGTLKSVKFNRGGTTLSMRLELDNGARAAFKPDQVILQLPRREIAAYRLDRLLGIGRVPPAIARSFPLADLIAAVDPAHRGGIGRLRTDAVARNGIVRGEMSWWIPVISDVYIGAARLDETDAIVTWRRWLRIDARIPADRVGLAHQVSAMTLFDFLTDNLDRWSGNNSKTSKDGTVLYFMDNTLSFGRAMKGSYRTRRYLERCQVFSRRVVGRLRALDDATLQAALAVDRGPYDELLTRREIAAVLGRRAVALGYIDQLIATHGEDKVLAFP